MNDDRDDEFDQEIDEMVAEASRALGAGESAAVTQDRGAARAAWSQRLAVLPRKVARILRTFTLIPLAEQALDEVERELFGWAMSPDPAVVATVWRRAMQRDAREATMKVARRVVHEAKRTAHVKQLGSHACASSLAPWQRDPRVRDGVLFVRDVPVGVRSFGVRSYLEATPVELVVLVVHRWMALTGRTCPRCWDLTAGSGTVGDVIRTIFGGVVAEFDIANQRSVSLGDLRDAGRHPLHRVRPVLPPGERRSPANVDRPDVVFVHPPSPGWPVCCEFLEGDSGRAATLDLAVLAVREGVERYVEVLATAVLTAAKRVAPGGLISVLVPEYVRFQQQVSPGPGIAEAILDRLEGRCVLLERHLVVDEAPVAQASLGRSRGRLVHLILSAVVSGKAARAE